MTESNFCKNSHIDWSYFFIIVSNKALFFELWNFPCWDNQRFPIPSFALYLLSYRVSWHSIIDTNRNMCIFYAPALYVLPVMGSLNNYAKSCIFSAPPPPPSGERDEGGGWYHPPLPRG